MSETYTGIGVMIGMLSGNGETVDALRSAIGSTISALRIVDEGLYIELSSGDTLRIWDGGQSCCEDRYMRTDDDLDYYIGAKLVDFELRDAPEVAHEWGVHEVQFLAVKTSAGELVMSSHVEHNGYYGGFCIQASLEAGE